MCSVRRSHTRILGDSYMHVSPSLMTHTVLGRHGVVFVCCRILFSPGNMFSMFVLWTSSTWFSLKPRGRGKGGLLSNLLRRNASSEETSLLVNVQRRKVLTSAGGAFICRPRT